MQRYLFYWFNEKMRAKSVCFFMIFSVTDEKNRFLMKKDLKKFGV